MSISKTVSPATVELAAGAASSRSIDDFELYYSRRAVERYRKLLGSQPLLDLLAEDIHEGNEYLRKCALAADGEFAGETTVLNVNGLNADDFAAWMGRAFDDEDVLLRAHPEHYAMVDQPDGTVKVVENIGPHVCSFFMGGWGTAALDWASGAGERRPEVDFPHTMASNLFLDDGTVVGRVMTQFGDSEDGFIARLTAYFPSVCPSEVLDHHLQHFAVEFRNWIVAASLETHGPAISEL